MDVVRDKTVALRHSALNPTTLGARGEEAVLVAGLGWLATGRRRPVRDGRPDHPVPFDDDRTPDLFAA